MSYNELLQRGTADFPIELYSVSEHDPRYEMVSHWHSEIEIIRIIDGTLEIQLNNNIYIANKNDILFINPEIIHSGIPHGCTYECLVFDVENLTAGFDGCKYFFDGLLSGEYHVCEYIPYRDSDICKSANKIFDIMKHKSSGYKFKVIGELFGFFGEVIDGHLYSHISGEREIHGDRNFMKLKNALLFMRENYDRPISLDDMSHAAGMSSKYFCRYFKEMTHKSPVEYLNTYRVEKAARKLISTDISVTDIAFMCGFNDLSYFIKTFKMYKGVTPSKFRRVGL